MRHHLKAPVYGDSPKRYIPEILAGQMVSIVGGLTAGALLGIYKSSFEPVAGFFLMLPGILNLPGDIQGSLAARINHNILRWPTLHKDKSQWANNVYATFLLAAAAGAVIGVMAMVFNGIAFGNYNWRLAVIGLFSALITNSILTPLVVKFTHFLFEKRHNPDNVMGPFVSSAGDLVAVVALAVAVMLLT